MTTTDLFEAIAALEMENPSPNGEHELSEPKLAAAYPDFQIRPAIDDLITVTGQTGKFEKNVVAIQVLQDIEAGDQPPTEAQLLKMARYSGWGPVPQVFDDGADRWKWGERRTRLIELLDNDDYEAARASTPNAMYTPPAVAREIWNALGRLGFEGGRILEPAVGNGMFLGTMPKDVFASSQITAVEMDRLSSRMCQALYPSANVINSGLQKAKLPEEYYDLVVSNVPFGNYKVFDPGMTGDPYLLKSVHNYFFAKALRLTRPGGLIAFITSRYTMDAADVRVRQHLSSHAELLGAVRLPFNTFSKFADTEVTTDIIFLRKREDEGDGGKSWTETVEMRLPELLGGESAIVHINEYYDNNPHMILGKHYVAEYGMYGNGHNVVVALEDGQRLKFLLPIGLRELPRNVYEETERHCLECGAEISDGELCPDCEFSRFNRKPVSKSIKEGSYFIGDDGKIYRKSNGYGDIVRGARMTISRIAGMIGVRDKLLQLVEKNLNPNVSDNELRPYQAKLTLSYHIFISRFGFVNNNANRSAFRDDPDAPLLFSIEDYSPATGRGTKMAIFSKRVIGAYYPPDKADTSEEALMIALNETGSIDWVRMTQLVGKHKAEMIYELGDVVFLSPSGRYIMRDEYLSGNVRVKLAAAIKAAGADDQYERNVQALQGVLPTDLQADEIFVALGAPWIWTEYVEQFANELVISDSHVNHMDDPGWEYEYSRPQWGAVQISYLKDHAEWIVSGSLIRSPLSTGRWGTNRIPADELLKITLNSKVATVKDRVDKPDGGHTYVLNAAETFSAREKQADLNKAFRKWLYLDAERKDRLVARYNWQFNSVVPRQYDGSHLTLPGMSVDAFTLHKHQLDAIWRVVQEPTTLLWHIVGAGKTAIMICAGMEMKRLRMRNKVVHAIPNHMLDQYATDFQKLYPGARVLTVNSKQLNKHKRREMLSRIATGDYDAVVMTHDALARIQVSAELFESFISSQIDNLRDFLHDVQTSPNFDKYSNHSRATIKNIEKKVHNLEAKLEKRRASLQHDHYNPLSWEQLGIDCLFVDEFHLFKNLFVNTRMRLPGVGNSESGRAFDMYLKTQFMTRRCTCGQMYLSKSTCRCSRDEGVPSTLVGATGTAVANTMGEVFTLLRYFSYQQLIDNDMIHFDAWAATFGEAVTMIEMKPSGSGYRQNTRFARFNNVPELLRMLYKFTDVQYDWREMGLKRPELMDGEVRLVAVDPSEALLKYICGCDIRYENLKNVDPSEDNVLKVIGDASKAATDMRLVTEDPADDEPGNKINTAVEMLYERYVATTGVHINGSGPVNLTQMVFLDSGVPHGANYDLYEDMRRKLVSRGVRPGDIAFIHEAKSDAAKLDLFDRMNRGVVRILIGSTSKMGVGTNAQRLLKTLYHLDCPWRPADIEQRDGRALRQGNMNPEVEVVRIVTKKSFDVYRWQVVETKAMFISQLMMATLTDRSIDDLDGAVISYAEAKAMASDDPVMLERVSVEARTRQLYSLYSAWNSSFKQMKMELRLIPGRRERLASRLDSLVQARDTYIPLLTQKFSMEVGLPGGRRRSCNTIKEAGTVLTHFANSMDEWECLESVASWNGCQIDLKKRRKFVEAVLHFRHDVIRFVPLGDKPAGNITRILNLVKALPGDIEKVADEIATCDRLLPQYENELARNEFEHMDELQACEARLEEIEAEIDAIRQAEEMTKMEQRSNSDSEDSDDEVDETETAVEAAIEVKAYESA